MKIKNKIKFSISCLTIQINNQFSVQIFFHLIIYKTYLRIKVKYFQNFSEDSLEQVEAVDVAKWRRNLILPFQFPLAQK